MISDTVGGTTIVVFWEPGTGSALDKGMRREGLAMGLPRPSCVS